MISSMCFCLFVGIWKKNQSILVPIFGKKQQELCKSDRQTGHYYKQQNNINNNKNNSVFILNIKGHEIEKITV